MKDSTIKGFAILATLVFWGSRIQKQDEIATKANYDRVVSEAVKPPIDSNLYVRGYNYNKGEWNVVEKSQTKARTTVLHQDYPQDILSDEEIRILREKQSFKPGGSYIYTPGRNVPSREKEIQRFIDKHGQEIYEQLEDKYGN